MSDSQGRTLPADIPVVRLIGAALTYPGTPPVAALRPANLTIQPGEYLTVIGPSGSGKSTLLNVLGLLDRPVAGSYQLDGVAVETLGEAARTALRGQRIGFVFQTFHLLPYRSALENVALALLYTGTARRQREQAATDASPRLAFGTDSTRLQAHFPAENASALR